MMLSVLPSGPAPLSAISWPRSWSSWVAVGIERVPGLCPTALTLLSFHTHCCLLGRQSEMDTCFLSPGHGAETIAGPSI